MKDTVIATVVGAGISIATQLSLEFFRDWRLRQRDRRSNNQKLLEELLTFLGDHANTPQTAVANQLIAKLRVMGLRDLEGCFQEEVNRIDKQHTDQNLDDHHHGSDLDEHLRSLTVKTIRYTPSQAFLAALDKARH